MLRVGLNGFGRIGRSFVRVLMTQMQAGQPPAFELAAINDLGDPQDLLYLSQFDSTHGPAPMALSLDDQDRLCFAGQKPRLLKFREPEDIPWKDLGVSLVLECTGEFRSYADAERHLHAGAARVILGAVPFDRADAILVYGINHDTLPPDAAIISAASCTTHAIAPLLALADECWGVECALMKEVHAYTSDQSLLDHVHRDPRRGRAAAQNIIPTTSSAISAIQDVLPNLRGRISGGSIRVPTLNVAMVDLTLRLRALPDLTTLTARMAEAASKQPRLIGYNDRPLVSVDFNRRMESCVFDATQTRILGDMVRLVAWYDNEWGYANRLLDLVNHLAGHTATAIAEPDCALQAPECRNRGNTL